MDFQIRPLTSRDAENASLLDKKWFGDHGISAEELQLFINDSVNNSLAIFHNEVLEGFATFEILVDSMPKDYVGNVFVSCRVLFLQQFTTKTNYTIPDMQIDTVLLSAVEVKAKELGCHEVWEALAKNHPYSKEQNPQFDAFGFYKSHGYATSKKTELVWSPSRDISIPCFLFRKEVS